MTMHCTLSDTTQFQPMLRRLTVLAASVILLAACGGSEETVYSNTATPTSSPNSTTEPATSTPTTTAPPTTTTTTDTSTTVTPPPAPIPVVTSSNYTIPTTHPRILLSPGRVAELQNRYAANGAAVTRFRQTVDLAVGGTNIYGFEAWNAALMRHVSGNINYCTWAVQRVDSYVASEETLINANQRATIAGDSYLEVGEHIANISMVYDWCYAQTSSTQRTRWITYMNQAVWNVWHPDQARWGNTVYAWSGWSVDNPVNNYYYSFLKATMMLGLATHGENAQAVDWITMFRDTKIASQLVPTFQRDLTGGGSREGTGYGTAMRELFWLYDVWEATTGEKLADLTGHTRASGPYLIHSVTPTLDRLAPIGDHARDSTAAFFDYHRFYALMLARLYSNDAVGRSMADFASRASVSQMSQHFQRWIDFVYEPSNITRKPLEDLYPVYYGSGTGHVFMRSDWTNSATWVHFTAGPYTESHAHHDQGQILLFKREWLAVDANIMSHSGIEQDEDLHNIVRLSRNGTLLRQREGNGPAQLYGLYNDADFTWAAGNLAPVYNSGDGVSTLDREVVFLKPNVVVVFDRVGGSGLTADWLLSSPVSPVQSGATATFTGSQSTMVARRIHPVNATTTVANWPSLNAGTSGGYRLAWSSGSGPFLVVLSLDGSVTNATAADVTGMHGTSITLADGRVVTLRFHDSQRGGTMEIRNGTNARQITLSPGVMSLPVFQNP